MPMPTECDHNFTVQSLDKQPQGRARLLVLHCEQCGFSFQQLTMRTDSEIDAEIGAGRG